MAGLTDTLTRALLRAVRTALTSPAPTRPAPERPPRTRSGQRPARGPADYPGDFTGRPRISYAPLEDDRPDPGEVVWTWVPYEEDHRQGKDRPVLLIGADGDWLLGLQLTSQDHDRDAHQEAAAGRYWTDIGTGGWDPQRRPSEVRVNRIIRIDPAAVRRTGARLDRDRFEGVAAEVLRYF